jgi:hypothetical protein
MSFAVAPQPVMPGPGSGTDEFAVLPPKRVVDGRDKPGHDGVEPQVAPL